MEGFLVCLVSLVDLVHLVDLVGLVFLVLGFQQDKRDKPDEPDKPMFDIDRKRKNHYLLIKPALNYNNTPNVIPAIF